MPTTEPPGWRIAIDRGGTFTDVVAHSRRGEERVFKLLSEPGVEQRALARILESSERVSVVHVGSTVATNALLTREGSRTGLVVTRGFGDSLTIDHQARPEIFDLFAGRRQPLSEDVVEIDERMLADGTSEQAPEVDVVRARLTALREQGVESLAVSASQNTEKREFFAT